MFEKHLKHFLEPWLSTCVLRYPSLGHCEGSGRVKTAKIKQKWLFRKFSPKKSCFGAIKAPEALGDLRTRSELPKLLFWWLKTKNSSTYIEKFKALNTHEIARIWDFPIAFCGDLVRICLTSAVWASPEGTHFWLLRVNGFSKTLAAVICYSYEFKESSNARTCSKNI